MTHHLTWWLRVAPEMASLQQISARALALAHLFSGLPAHGSAAAALRKHLHWSANLPHSHSSTPPYMSCFSPRQENIHHAVSEGFVVATRRTRTAGKVDIPTMDDPVGKLEHMGKETVKKLQDIQAAAQQV